MRLAITRSVYVLSILLISFYCIWGSETRAQGYLYSYTQQSGFKQGIVKANYKGQTLGLLKHSRLAKVSVVQNQRVFKPKKIVLRREKATITTSDNEDDDDDQVSLKKYQLAANTYTAFLNTSSSTQFSRHVKERLPYCSPFLYPTSLRYILLRVIRI